MDNPRVQLNPPWHLLIIAICGALVTAGLGVNFIGDITGSGFDSSVAHTIEQNFDTHSKLMHVFVSPTQPYVLIPIILAVGVLQILARRWDLAVSILFGPAFTLAVNSWILKPAFDRHFGNSLAYPSGHTVSLVATVIVLVFIVNSTAKKWLIAVLGAVLLFFAGIGMIALGFHYATDVIGGTAFAVAAISAMQFVFALIQNAKAQITSSTDQAPH